MDSPPFVPYQAYRSKRHSRNASSQSTPPPPVSTRPAATADRGFGDAYSEPVIHKSEGHAAVSENGTNGLHNGHALTPKSASTTTLATHQSGSVVLQATGTDLLLDSTVRHEQRPSVSPLDTGKSISSPGTTTTVPSGKPTSAVLNGRSIPASPVAGPSTSSSRAVNERPLPTARKTSTFRHVPLRPPSSRHTLTPSPLRNSEPHARTLSNTSSTSRTDPAKSSDTSSHVSSLSSTPSVTPLERTPQIPALDLSRKFSLHPDVLIRSPISALPVQASRTSSLTTPVGLHLEAVSSVSASPAVSPAPVSPSTAASSPSPQVRTIIRSSAPYRPGFQPKGVYRPRTDEFVGARKSSRDVGRIERARLERRLEKLISLHFPPPELKKQQEKVVQADDRPHLQNKRMSSIFDLDFSELRSKSASDLFREVVTSQGVSGKKNSIRDEEQRITPWEDDSAVASCPLCSASFHPITNRKHHCRLCGRIICSLPVKYPQRPQMCSLLFVADPNGLIEEVGEGVDYGVRRHSTPKPQGKGAGQSDALGENEKFLKGVRICRDCRPVLLRHQYKYETQSVPIFAKLYEAFITLEKEIENALPHFQELMLSLSKQERPTPEASAARKRLLEAFGQYDALGKRIRKLPCRPGSSQDRIQAAIATRANLFLQKHMFPLQSLPKPKNTPSPATDAYENAEPQVIDPDSEVAHVLQPLLEQEALLESFIEEAKAHRKFEDAKTLKTNLEEIRAEIERILTNAEDRADARRETPRTNGR
ncbi:hypothetical protein OBBRIDRAFT_788793 [Obba rivulosa]|uniref:FYVE-type domain-containing protein n=1 Tax=Obba rivulosa TaxID=1052685 RepID=A0A8E2DSU1_9APHY|nr:hypothetical protein OBBRIDRAFT_788793 [Obba rivulosa]